MSANSVHIFDVGPRDGLQNEKQLVSFKDKIWLIQSLAQAGVEDIEAGAFVRADKVPQMAESEQIQDALVQTKSSSRFWYLVPNVKGLERALSKKVKHIALFTAVSNQFNQKNIGMSVDESFDEIKEIIKQARTQDKNIKIRGYISTVWGCPFEGKIAAKKAVAVIERMLKLNVDQVSIGDTIGVAAPKGVKEVLKSLKSKKLAVHFHDTRGTALANSLMAYEMGIKTFDSSVGGLGGCPFAPGAAGNLATEDLVYMFKEMGVDTGIDYQKLCQTSLEFSKRMGNRPLSSKALQAFQKSPSWDT